MSRAGNHGRSASSGGARALVLVALAVAATVAILFAVLGGPDGARHPGDPRPADPVRAPGPEPSLAAPALDPDRATVDVPAPPPVGPSDAAREERRKWATVWVYGTVLARTSESEKLTLIVRPGANVRKDRARTAFGATWGGVERDGTFRVDVSAAFPQGAETIPDKLTIQALRDGFPPTEVEVEVPFGLEQVMAGGTLEIPVEIRLRRTCTLSLSAAASDDASAHVEIAAFPLIGGEPGPVATATASSDGPDDAVEIVLDCDIDHVLVAFAQGYRPTTKTVVAGDLTHLDVRLERGATLAGRSTLAGRALEGTVQARLAAAGERADLPNVNGTAFAWSGGAFEWHSVSSRTAADGSFEFAGLAPAEYQVLLAGVAGVFSSNAARVAVVAPAGDVELVPEVCELRVTLVAGGEPAANANVSVQERTAEGSTVAGSSRTDAHGRLVLWARPWSTVRLTAGKEHELRCGDAGTSTEVRLVE